MAPFCLCRVRCAHRRRELPMLRGAHGAPYNALREIAADLAARINVEMSQSQFP